MVLSGPMASSVLLPSYQDDRTLLQHYVARNATPEEADLFIEKNCDFISEKAKRAFLDMSPQDQCRVIQMGPMRPCDNSVEVLYARLKESAEMERQVRTMMPALGASRVKAAMTRNKPSTGIVAAIAQQLSNPKYDEVPEEQRRCAGKAVDNMEPLLDVKATGSLAGTSQGVGGVIESMGKKYSMQKGERARVIRETRELWVVEGDRSVPKTQKNIGWKWIVQGADQVQKKKQEELERNKRVKVLLQAEKQLKEETEQDEKDKAAYWDTLEVKKKQEDKKRQKGAKGKEKKKRRKSSSKDASASNAPLASSASRNSRSRSGGKAAKKRKAADKEQDRIGSHAKQPKRCARSPSWIRKETRRKGGGKEVRRDGNSKRQGQSKSRSTKSESGEVSHPRKSRRRDGSASAGSRQKGRRRTR